MSSDWIFITFGAGLPNWRAAARRLGRQASDSGYFGQTRVFTERELISQHPDFAEKHRRILSPRVKGFGYWIWKPYLIWKGLEYALSNGMAGVTYLDAGCELNLRSEAARERLMSYRRMATRSGVFAMHLEGYLERDWTRLEVMDSLGMTDDARISPQVQATPMFIASQASVNFARTWFELCVQDSYFLVRDPIPGEILDPNFSEHRHDQSVFSGLIKKQDVPTIPDETFWAPDWADRGINYPLWAARNRTRISVLDSSPRGKAIRFGERVYSRIHRDLSVLSRSHS